MNRSGRARPWWRMVAALACVPLAAGLGACAEKEAKGSHTISVELKPDGCEPPHDTVDPGPTTFDVKNSGADNVSELELLRAGRIVGEKENLTPGLSGSFTVTLRGGAQYQLYCPGAKTEKSTLKVKGGQAASQGSGRQQRVLRRGVKQYQAYVEDQVNQLTANAQALAAAIKAGDIAKAKSLYPAGRLNYERIEPIAETFGAGGVLDLHIDGRIDDYPKASEFRGFHKLEQALWQKGTTAGMGPVADQLVVDIAKLQKLVPTLRLQPEQIANGATELLNEVSQTKITGEEERYSRLDILDMAGNVQGAKQAFEVLEPALTTVDAGLARTVGERFTDVEADLSQFERGGSYVPYDELSKAQVRKLSNEVDALAEPLSQVAAKVSGLL